MQNASDRVRENISVHERIATVYDQRHPEIYNSIEQDRLYRILAEAIEVSSQTQLSHPIRALDYGCGAGNLTRHLLDLGCRVVAADVTPSFAQLVVTTYGSEYVTPLILNGIDLHELPDNSFDVVATYSVLHHIPDYLTAIREMIRVTRPGGVVFLDHERSPEFWVQSEPLREFQRKTAVQTPLSYYLRSIVNPKWYVKKFKKIRNPRYQEEGDIHVWPDDHIEWELIKDLVAQSNADIVKLEDYLSYQPHYDVKLWESYASLCSDMRVCIIQKSPSAQ